MTILHCPQMKYIWNFRRGVEVDEVLVPGHPGLVAQRHHLHRRILTSVAYQGSRKEMNSPRFNSVEEYLASVDPTKERTLRSVIDLILTQFPELESKISWNVPTIHRNGKYVVGLAAYKHHLTFSPWSPRVIEDFKVRLGKFVVFKKCFQIPVDWKIDRKLVKDLVRARLAELD